MNPKVVVAAMQTVTITANGSRVRLDGVAPAFEHARQAAGLALEVKAQRELVHVLEGAVGELAHRVLARRYGAEAHFVANNGWLVISIVLAFTGFFIAAPGHKGSSCSMT